MHGGSSAVDQDKPVNLGDPAVSFGLAGTGVLSLMLCKHFEVFSFPTLSLSCCVQVGFKLLAFDVSVASGLAFKAMRGNTLTR